MPALDPGPRRRDDAFPGTGITRRISAGQEVGQEPSLAALFAPTRVAIRADDALADHRTITALGRAFRRVTRAFRNAVHAVIAAAVRSRDKRGGKVRPLRGVATRELLCLLAFPDPHPRPRPAGGVAGTPKAPAGVCWGLWCVCWA